MDLSTILIGAAVVAMGGTLYYQFKTQKQTESNFDKNTAMIEAQANEFLEKENYSFIKGNILFLLSDLMHDGNVFERFTHDEINDIFLKARKLTSGYAGQDAPLNELIAFEDFLKNEVWPKRYPSWGAFNQSDAEAVSA